MTLQKSFLDVEIGFENLAFTASAMLSPTKNTNKALAYLGLESTTAISAQISEEGILSWINSKVEKLGHKLWYLVNKLYIKLKGTSEKNKALLERAKTDPKVKLPLSFAAVGRILSVGGMIVAVTAAATVTNAESVIRLKKNVEKCKTVLNDMETNGRDNEEAKANVRKNINAKQAELNKSSIYHFSRKLDKILAAIWNNLKKFAESFKRAKPKTDNKEAGKSFWENIKNWASSASGMFTVIRLWLSKLTKVFSKTPVKMLPAPKH